MNKWQEQYINYWYDGKKPRGKRAKMHLELLGKIKEYVQVTFSDGRTEEYKVVLENSNMPKGIISCVDLVGNLELWLSRGHKITTTNQSTVK